jgi:flagellar motor protein MotB
MKSIILHILFFTVAGSSIAQINVMPPSENLSIEAIIQSIEGEGIIVQNITTNNKKYSNQLARFEDSLLFTGMQNGMLLSTGSVKAISGANKSSGMTGPISSEPGAQYASFPISNVDQQGVVKTIVTNADYPHAEGSLGFQYPANNTTDNSSNTSSEMSAPESNFSNYHMSNAHSGDADIQAELGGGYMIYDACVVEMDIIPLGDTLSFRYMFASEEYDEYVGTQFNDAFAFFISGPGIEKKKNLAVLESGSRVSVNSINNGNPSKKTLKPSNPSFYNRNIGQIPLEFDGFTRTLEIIEPVIAFETYHLKIVIADAGDGAYDSGVFIEEGSVISYDYKYVIPFDTDISNLDEEARKILLGMTKIAHNHPEYVLQITGHTDSDGSEASNLILSQNRINSVVNYILDEGFLADDILTVNKGESMPMTTNETNEGKEQNRRVEIKLIPSVRQNNSTIISRTELINYPNPARTSTTIEVRSDRDYDGASIRVHSTNGKIIEEQSLAGTKVTFDTSDWDAGIYFYSLYSNGEQVTSSRLVVVN